jgi:hypothetical protein
MRSRVRTGWIVVGGALTALAVLVLPVTAWTDIREPGTPYGVSLISSKASETSVQVYRLASPVIVVLVPEAVDVRVVPGQAGRLSVERKVTWSRERPDFSESWDGRRLAAEISCARFGRPPDPDCRMEYTLGVPAGVRVEGRVTSAARP